MGREVRRVPKDWKHPMKDGRYVPLHGRSFAKDVASWNEEAAQWAKGLRRSYGADGEWEPHEKGADYSYSDWAGERPVEAEYMPDWPEAERTHLQMYEDTSEGTPISPVMATPEDLARWLADTGASAFGDMTATYEQWLRVAQGGWAPSAVVRGGMMTSGVAAIDDTP